MTGQYKIRKKAKEDLQKIWLYTLDHWGVKQADDYIRLIIKKFEWLAENPKAGQARYEIKPGYFCIPIGSHLIFYILTEQQPDIISVVHQKSDIAHWIG